MHALAPSFYNITHLVLVCSPRLARPCLSGTTSLALHLFRGETAEVAGGLSCVALGVSFLAAKAELLVLLLALAYTGASFSAIGLGVVGLQANVEEVFLVGLGDICALAF